MLMILFLEGLRIPRVMRWSFGADCCEAAEKRIIRVVQILKLQCLYGNCSSRGKGVIETEAVGSYIEKKM